MGDMKILLERLWKVVPVPVVSLERMPGRLVGLSMGIFVLIRADHAHDRSIIVHELEHCRQFWRGGTLLHMLRYHLSRRYRLQSEIAAFRAEILACAPALRSARLDDAAQALASGYHIGLDTHACRRLLSCPLPSDDSWTASPSIASLRSTSSRTASGRSTGTT